MADTPAAGASPTSNISALASALKLPLALACIVAIALTTYYFFYVTDKHSYLIERDFRLLATIGQEIHEAIESDQQVLKNLLNSGERNGSRGEDNCHGWNLKEDPSIKQCVAQFIPVLRVADVLEWPKYRPNRTDADVRLQFVDETSSVWTDGRDATASDAVFQLKFADLVTPFIDTAMVRSAFDSVFVVASDGRVVARSGGVQPYITRFDKLADLTDPKKPTKLDFDAVSRTAAMVDVEAFGSVYTMFTQPCCAGLTRKDSQKPDDGMALCALAQRKKLTSASYAVPFAIAFFASLGLCVSLLGWPFLRLRCIGEFDRVRRHDVVMVGLSALIGVGLVAILTLDMFAAERLRGLLDDQLVAFATEVQNAAGSEITAASTQLDILEDVARPWSPEEHGLIFNNQGGDKSYFSDEQLRQYPWFRSFATLDDTGRQQKKLVLEKFVTSLVNVSPRSYFKHWIPALGLATTPEPSGGSSRFSASSSTVFLDSIRSSTTGTREVVLSKLSKDVHVETLAIPMRSLINPIVPRGFGFAIVDSEGKVQFHSDPEHKLLEDFFLESDRNRRLRALAAAKGTEQVDISYWGRDWRAYVQPFAPSRDLFAREWKLFDREWTIVTFFEQDLLRTVRMEWLVHALLFFVIYLGVYIAICVGVLIVAPGYRAPWLWPDPGRSGAYLDLLPPLACLALTFTLAIATSAPGPLLIIGWLVPFLAWTAVYVGLLRERCQGRLALAAVGGVAIIAVLIVIALRNMSLAEGLPFVALTMAGVALPLFKLRTRTSDRSSPSPPPVSASYGFAAGLLLLVTALLPGVAFFKVGWDLQIRTFVKYGQLELARHGVEREQREGRLLAEQFSPDGRTRMQPIRATSPIYSAGAYHAFFFDSAQEPGEPLEAAPQKHALPELIEELLPFYSESSVRFRELVHDQSADESWRWTQSRDKLFLHSPAGATQPTISSTVPRLVDGVSGGRPFALLVVAIVAMIGALVWVVRFLLYEVFLVDIIGPFSVAGAETHPQRVFRVSESVPKVIPGRRCLVDVATAPERPTERADWLAAQLTLIHVASATRGVLIINFSHRLSDRSLADHKLALVEHALHDLGRAIEIYSTAPPSVVLHRIKR